MSIPEGPPLWSKETISPYPEGTLIRLKGKAQAYVIRGGRKCYIPDPETFQAHGFQSDQVIEVDQSTFSKIQTGIPLPSVKPPTLYGSPGIPPPGIGSPGIPTSPYPSQPYPPSVYPPQTYPPQQYLPSPYPPQSYPPPTYPPSTAPPSQPYPYPQAPQAPSYPPSTTPPSYPPYPPSTPPPSTPPYPQPSPPPSSRLPSVPSSSIGESLVSELDLSFYQMFEKRSALHSMPNYSDGPVLKGMVLGRLR